MPASNQARSLTRVFADSNSKSLQFCFSGLLFGDKNRCRSIEKGKAKMGNRAIKRVEEKTKKK